MVRMDFKPPPPLFYFGRLANALSIHVTYYSGPEAPLTLTAAVSLIIRHVLFLSFA